MSFRLKWSLVASRQFDSIQEAARKAMEGRKAFGKRKSSRQEGLFVQIVKSLNFLAQNPRHPGLHTHEFSSIENPFDSKQKVFEAYAQNKTPGAYRIFWCYGPGSGEITILAITPHP